MVNLYKDDDYNKPKVGAGTSSVGGASQVAPAAAPASSPVPVGQNSEAAPKTETPGLTVEKNTNEAPKSDVKTIDDIYAEIKLKIRKGEALTPEEQKIFDQINEAPKDSKEKAEQSDNGASINKKEQIPPEVKQKYGEYKELEDQGGTEYEKTSRILDKYLSENDEGYQALKEKLANTKDKRQKLALEKQLQAKRDKIIHDWQAVVNPDIENKDLSLNDRKRGIREIGKIFAYAGANGIKDETQLNDLKKSQVITDIKNNKIETEILAKPLRKLSIRMKRSLLSQTLFKHLKPRCLSFRQPCVPCPIFLSQYLTTMLQLRRYRIL